MIRIPRDVRPPDWLDRTAYPFESRAIDLTAGRMHYVDEGQGEAILFVHGTPTWSFEYRHLIRALSRRWRCIAPDHLGFGLSERPEGLSYTPEAHAANLTEFVSRLGLERFTLVAHDFGGPIGLPLALGPSSRVTRLILLNTWAWSIDNDARMARGARLIGGPIGRLLYKYANASLNLIMPSAYGDRTKLTPAIHAQYTSVFEDREARVRVLHALARALLGSRDFYDRLANGLSDLRNTPTLIVWGLKDTAFRPDYLARWQRILPFARTVTLSDAGHWPHEEDPQRVVKELVDFMGTTSSGASP